MLQFWICLNVVYLLGHFSERYKEEIPESLKLFILKEHVLLSLEWVNRRITL